MTTYQKVIVLDIPHYEGCDTIWAEIDGKDAGLSYDQVADARLVCSDRDDGLETLILSDGRQAVVQSIDLDYGGAE